MLLVTGATGNVGGELVLTLIDADGPMHALTRGGCFPAAARPSPRPSPTAAVSWSLVGLHIEADDPTDRRKHSPTSSVRRVPG